MPSARQKLSALPSTLRGAPSAPPDESKGYAGGLLPAVRVLGAYLGDAEVAAQLQEVTDEADRDGGGDGDEDDCEADDGAGSAGSDDDALCFGRDAVC